MQIQVRKADIREFPCDLLVLKHAQAFYGADRAVAHALQSRGEPVERLLLPPGSHLILPTNGAAAASRVLYLGVPGLGEFGYDQIEDFTRRALEICAAEAPETAHLGLTLHGAGYGLDEMECARRQVRAIRRAQTKAGFPKRLALISFVENDEDRADLLRRFLAGEAGRPEETGMPTPASVFAAVPFAKSMRAVWKYGIYQPVRDKGLLCEGGPTDVEFTGNILTRICRQIESASLVIADLTGSNPNVFLEVGFAWGKDRPTLLLMQLPEGGGKPALPFDVQGHRCIFYEDAVDLDEKLRRSLDSLLLSAPHKSW